ncbi:tripartite tricarboxylate transporter substrate binding protein [Nesterenkonia halophila]|uniref:tripartite tricarboxylate transporter substrate binding protein n=1 Tax=Nesterenkonia halophila TaxID=302044 RepID=UPI00129292AE|nr:tripartite tricarboxylate transporter substrate binding protein [Nesterenkonia halophila]
MHRISNTPVRALAVSAAGLLALTGCADRQNDDETADFPSEDITVVVPYDAGGASDLAARTLVGELEDELDASIVVENRSGGAGSVGLDHLAGQDADGYTLGYLPVETVMLGHQGYDIDPSDYEPLGQIVSVPATIAVPADSEYETLEDLLAAAEDEELSVANSGTGSIWHAATSALNEEAGTQLDPVPFDGGAPAVTAAVGGQVDAVVAGVSETATAAEDDQLRVLAVLDDERADAMPDVPTAEEQGHDVSIGGWGAIGAPEGLPDDVREALVDAISSAADSEEFVETIESSGNIAVNVGPEEFQPFYEEENARFESLFSE